MFNEDYKQTIIRLYEKDGADGKGWHFAKNGFPLVITLGSIETFGFWSGVFNEAEIVVRQWNLNCYQD